MSGEVVYFELPGNDAAAAQRFWDSLFGWTFTASNGAEYSMIDGSSPVAGLAHGDPSPHPRIFFRVDDLGAAVARVGELGGQADEPVTIPAGAFARCTDDQGVTFSLFQARSQ